MELLDFQQRVVDEKKELDEKIDKLKSFTNSDRFDSLAKRDSSHLIKQLAYMEGYRGILADRIALFDPLEVG